MIRTHDLCAASSAPVKGMMIDRNLSEVRFRNELTKMILSCAGQFK